MSPKIMNTMPVRRASRRRCAALATSAVTLSLGTGGAVAAPMGHGEPSPSERAIAEHMYERGRAQLAAGETAAACDSFAESNRLVPGTGILLNLAACHEQQGLLASAWVEFREAMVSIRREERRDRERYAKERLAAIEARLAFLTIAVPDEPAGDAPVVELDARELGRPTWGVGMPVDAGAHRVVARWSGGRRWSHDLAVLDGHRYTVQIPEPPAPRIEVRAVHDERATDGCDTGNRAASPCPAIPAVAVALAPSPPAPAGSTARRTAGWTVAAAGAGALLAGAGFGLRAALLWSDRNRECPQEECSRDGLRLGDRAYFSATVSTWALAVGAATVGVAALVLWGPAARPVPPSSALSPAARSTARASHLEQLLRHVGVDHRGHLALGGTF